MPAKSMSSYADTLYAILDEFKPESAFEWGPGTSTQIMCFHPAVKEVTSVEHDKDFYDSLDAIKLRNLVLLYKPTEDDYVNSIGESIYDIIFVDGRSRVKCLEKARALSRIVLLHDARRAHYRDEIDKYKYAIWSDEGNTVTLTDDKRAAERLMTCIPNQCKEPSPEFVRIESGAKEFNL